MIYTTQRPLCMSTATQNHARSPSQVGTQNNEANTWILPTRTPEEYSELRSTYQLSKDNGRRRRWSNLLMKYRDVYPRESMAWQLAMTASK